MQDSMRKLDDRRAAGIMKKYGIPFAREALARDEGQALASAGRIGYPVALKVSSPDIVHKTEKGCVLTGVCSGDALSRGFRTIMRNARKAGAKRVDGVMVQEMARPGSVELIVGMKRDPQFGPVIMFGLGGIFTEILRDVSFRLIPIRRADAAEMMHEIKGRKVLEGARGREPVPGKVVEDLLLAVSRMAEREGVQELDLNPVFADGKGLMAVDARVMVG
jgi:acyl-CoA synthetase (NDP forming)